MKVKRSIKKIYQQYVDNLGSIKTFFQKFGELALLEDKTSSKKQREIINGLVEEIQAEINPYLDAKTMQQVANEEPIELTDKEKQELSKSISGVMLADWRRRIRELNPMTSKNFEILSRSSFLMLNNYLEYLLTDLLTYYYSKFQQSLNETEFKFTLREVNEFETVEDLTEMLIQREVEALLIEKSFPQLLEHFKNSLKIDLEESTIDWELINEARERRHLIVHNSSTVNKKYISRTGNPHNFNIGDHLEINAEYFFQVWEEIQLAGILLCFNSWGKWDKKKSDDAISEILNQTFSYLQLERYNEAERLASYATKISATNDQQQDLLLRIKMNGCIALKKMGESSKLEEKLKTIKVGTAAPIFKLVYSILADNHSDILEQVKKAKALGEIGIDEYNVWPVFTFLHSDEAVDRKIREVLEAD